MRVHGDSKNPCAMPTPDPNSGGRGLVLRQSGCHIFCGSGGAHTGNLTEDFLVFGKAKRLQFGKDSLAVHCDFKRSTVSLDEPCYNTKLLFDRGLQTCSVRKVVSFNTVFDCNIHHRHSLVCTGLMFLLLQRHSSGFPLGRQAALQGRCQPVEGDTRAYSGQRRPALLP